MSEKVIVKVVKCRDNAEIPETATTGSAGLDLRVAAFIDKNGNDLDMSGLVLDENKTTVIRCATGLKVEIPEGYCMKILPRSGFAFNEDITVINSPGLIDSDYRGEIIVGLIKHHTSTSKPTYLNVGDRIAQGIIEKIEIPEFEIVDELTETERAEGGFGHTGAN